MATHRNPVCSKPVSGDDFIRAETRYPLQYDALQRNEPPLTTRFAIVGSSLS